MSCDGELRKRFLRPSRRSVLAGMAALLASKRAKSLPNEVREDDLRNLRLQDLSEGGRRFVLVSPRYQNPDAPIPLVVLLHGLGETVDERLGAYAWMEKYGLGSAWQRLVRPPIERESKRGEWTDARLAEVNAELAARPFRGFAMACPFMPNPKSAAEIDAYAKWIETVLIPRARKEVPTIDEPRRTYLCGVSLGGYVSLEVLTRLPRVFGAWAGVQTAIGTFAAPRYAEKIAAAGPPPGASERPLLVLTSTQDHWKESSEALVSAFNARGLPNTFRLVPGPHDQPWLREAGTIETLLWLDRLWPQRA